eukprot:tig00001086_g6836.t1
MCSSTAEPPQPPPRDAGSAAVGSAVETLEESDERETPVGAAEGAPFVQRRFFCRTPYCQDPPPALTAHMEGIVGLGGQRRDLQIDPDPLGLPEPSPASAGRPRDRRRTYVVGLRYLGSAFEGYARQTGKETVEGVVLKALAPLSSTPLTVMVAGRTDAGVHALGQLVSFYSYDAIDHAAIRAAIDACCPGALRVTFVRETPRSFHAVFSARWRRYAYYVDAGAGLDVALLDRMLGRLVSPELPRDMTAFARDTPLGKNTEKRLLLARARPCRLAGGEPAVRIDLAADGFLRRQVRVLASTAVREALAGSDEDALVRIAATRDRLRTADPGHPHRLCFMQPSHFEAILPRCQDVGKPDADLRRAQPAAYAGPLSSSRTSASHVTEPVLISGGGVGGGSSDGGSKKPRPTAEAESEGDSDTDWMDGSHKHELDGIEPSGPYAELYSHTQLDVAVEEIHHTMMDLPTDIRIAVESGGIKPDTVRAYGAMEADPRLRFFLRLSGGWRERLLADPKFLYKLGVAELVMFTSRLSAEVKKRGKNFWREFDLAFANVANGTISQFFLVWVLAPTHIDSLPNLRLSSYYGASGRIMNALDALPSYFYQPSPASRPYSLLDRWIGFGFKATLFGLIGFLAGGGGALVAQGLRSARFASERRRDPGLAPPPQMPVLKTALAYAAFCTFSATPRYHTVNGVEDVMQRALGKESKALFFAILFVRWYNNFYGGKQWIDIQKWTGVDPNRRVRCNVWPFLPAITHLTCTPAEEPLPSHWETIRRALRIAPSPKPAPAPAAK